MNLPVSVVLVVGLVCVHNSSGNFWENKMLHCGVSVWSEWTARTAPAPRGTRTRHRTVVRNPRNGGNACPTLTETVSRTDNHRTSMVFHSSVGHGARTGGGLTLLPRDLLFIIDMSGSISRSSWTLTKLKLVELIDKLCGSIGRGRQNNRIAILTFSSRVVLNFNFKTHWTMASVRRAILRMPQDRRGTCTGDAFAYAHQHIFQPDTGMRSATESVKEVLLLADGQSTCGANLLQNLRRLQVNAFIFSLGIGNFNIRGETEIRSMASRPLTDHIFSLAHFIDFRQMAATIMQYPDHCVPMELG